jgi:hypothetical protein
LNFRVEFFGGEGMKKVLLLGIIVVLVLTLTLSLVGCKNNEFTSDKVTYDGEYLRWEAITGIEKYQVSVNGGEAVEVTGTEYMFSASDTFSVKITTVPDKQIFGKSLGKELEVEKTFTFLSKVTDVTYTEGVLNWTEVEGADSYSVQINQSIVNASVLGTSFTVPDSTGQVAVRIIAQKTGSSHFSKWSDTLSMYILPSPENLKYSGETGLISWDGVSQATAYNVIINNGQPVEVAGTSYNYNANKTSFDVKVQAIGNNNNIKNSKIPESVEYLYLAPITHFSVNDGVLSWEEIENATSYKLKVKHQGAEQILSQAGRTYANLDPGKAYTVEVFPMTEGKNYFSSWTETETINILSIPENVMYTNDNQITWEGVSNATAYKISYYENGTLTKTDNLAVGGNTGVNVADSFNEVAEYQVRIQADTNQNTYYASKQTDPITIIRLPKPASYQVTDNPLIADSTNVTFNRVTNASSYQIRYDNTTVQNTVETSFKPLFDDGAIQESQTIAISIYSKGDISNHSSKRYVLDSIESLSFELKRLATPSNLRVDNGTIKWDDVEEESGYAVYLNGSNISELSARELIVPEIEAGGHTIAIKAKGNGTNIVSSALSNEYNVTKLATPQSLQIANGKVSWQIVDGCTGYKISLSQNNLNSDIAEFSLNVGAITTVGSIVNIYALGNGTNVIDSDVSLSLTVRKLTPPSEIKLSLQGDNVIWNAPSNKNQSSVLYNVKVGGVSQQNGMSLSSASWSAGNLVVGQNNITVQAKGDNSETFDSDYSSSTNITKLAPMSVSISSDKTKYEWADVINASQYTYRIGGGAIQTLSNSVKSWAPGFTVAKTEETVFFRAKGNYNQNICDSEEISRTISIISLTKIPDEKIRYEYSAAGNYFNVIVEETYETENANQEFILNTSGTERRMNERTFQYVFSGAPTISFNVKAVGGYFGESVGGTDKYYVTSSPSSTKTMTVFGAPSVSVVKLVEDSYQVDFGVQDGVTQLEYEIIFIVAGEDETQPATTQQASIIISSNEFSSREATGFKIKARALGEAENDTYDSKWSSTVITYLN